MKPIVTTGTFAELATRVVPIRHQVFVLEQQVPLRLEQDDRDSLCRHVLVEWQGTSAATGRLDSEKSGKIGRVAVLREFRQCRLGTAVMSTLEEIAVQEYQLPSVWLHAQVDVIGFYEKLGYQLVGSPFLEAGIEHVKMIKPLS